MNDDMKTLLTEKKEAVVEHEINAVDLSWRERVVVEEHERLSPHLIFEIIRRDGIEELLRPTKSLIFSGLAAGILVSFSFLCMAILNNALPSDASWAPLIAKWGYTIGFILVILGRLQLFTENTITTVVPIFKPFSPKKIWFLLRLWVIVLGSNLVGTALAASFMSLPGVVDAPLSTELAEIARHVAHFSPWENIIRGIPSGILIASIVWMMPSARHFSFFIIAFFTYFIALGDFTHVVVGSAEMFYAVLNTDATIFDYIFRFLLPTGLGNVLGGTGVFTLLIYGQIGEELKEK